MNVSIARVDLEPVTITLVVMCVDASKVTIGLQQALVKVSGNNIVLYYVFFSTYCTMICCIMVLFLCVTCIAMHCIALHCIALHCIPLHCIASHCIPLHCIISILSWPVIVNKT